MKMKVFVQQLRERRIELSVLDEGALTEQSKKLNKHIKRLVKTTRTIHMTYASMMVGIAECVPLGVLQGAFYKHSVFVHLLLMYSCAFTAPTRQGPDVYGLTHHHLVMHTDRSRACTVIKDLGRCMLGLKISKVPELHGLWQYKARSSWIQACNDLVEIGWVVTEKAEEEGCIS